MKNKIAIIVCLLLAGLTIAATTQRKHEVVILKGYVDGKNVRINETTTAWQYTGISVLTASSSAGAPQIQTYNGATLIGLPMSETIAQLMDAGFDIQRVADYGEGLTVTLIK